GAIFASPPIWLDQAAASSGSRRRSASTRRVIAATRSAGDNHCHGPSSKALRAATTARSMSVSSASATRATTCSVSGETISSWRPECGSTQAPPMNRRSGWRMLVAIVSLQESADFQVGKVGTQHELPDLIAGERNLRGRAAVPGPPVVVGSRVRPDFHTVTLVDYLVVAPIGSFFHLDRPAAVEDELLHALQGIPDRHLVKLRHRQATIRVGPVQRPKVRKARHHAAEVRPGAVRGPKLLDRLAVAPGNAHRVEEVIGLEAGRVHDDIDIVLIAVPCLDTRAVDTLDPARHQRGVIPLDHVQDAIFG